MHLRPCGRDTVCSCPSLRRDCLIGEDGRNDGAVVAASGTVLYMFGHQRRCTVASSHSLVMAASSDKAEGARCHLPFAESSSMQI